jgi:transcriptional regulator with XRE-family HTH domain
MTANESAGNTGDHIIETQLRAALSDARRRDQVLAATEWDRSMISKVMSGDTGITIDKLDALCAVLGLSMVSTEYLDYLARGNAIGANCCRTRASRGQCGPRG